MTLDEAIEHSKERAENERCPSCAKEHSQLAKWLEELKELRKYIMTQDESFVLCAAFRYAQGRQTFAMGIVVNHICKQLDRMSAVDIQQFLLEIDRRRKYGGPWGLQEEDHVNRLEKELREKL